MKMIVAGELKLRIHAKYPLTETQQAHRDLEGRKTSGKLLLIPCKVIATLPIADCGFPIGFLNRYVKAHPLPRGGPDSN